LVNEQKKSAVTRGAAVAGRTATATPAGSDFVRGVVTELRRVTWPTRDEWVSATVLTVGLVVVIGFFTWALDWGFTWLFDQIHLLNI
jgi:preprotein translocase SecE subunit